MCCVENSYRKSWGEQRVARRRERALCSLISNGRVWDVRWSDAVRIRPVCTNSNQRVRQKIRGSPVVFQMLES